MRYLDLEPNEERIAILEMLLWKYHKEGIPIDVSDRLEFHGFLERTNRGTFVWTELSEIISKEFNDKFNYIN